MEEFFDDVGRLARACGLLGVYFTVERAFGVDGVYGDFCAYGDFWAYGDFCAYGLLGVYPEAGRDGDLRTIP